MEQNTNYPSSENIVNVTQQGAWTYWIVQQTGGLESIVPLPHPMHLHGHDYYILGTGVGVFDMVNDPPTLQYDNPTRRDTTFLPADGWLAIAFPADNPGAWLFHCHIVSPLLSCLLSMKVVLMAYFEGMAYLRRSWRTVPLPTILHSTARRNDLRQSMCGLDEIRRYILVQARRQWTMSAPGRPNWGGLFEMLRDLEEGDASGG